VNAITDLFVVAIFFGLRVCLFLYGILTIRHWPDHRIHLASIRPSGFNQAIWLQSGHLASIRPSGFDQAIWLRSGHLASIRLDLIAI
jgi:hypothetical protein